MINRRPMHNFNFLNSIQIFKACYLEVTHCFLIKHGKKSRGNCNCGTIRDSSGGVFASLVNIIRELCCGELNCAVNRLMHCTKAEFFPWGSFFDTRVSSQTLQGQKIRNTSTIRYFLHKFLTLFKTFIIWGYEKNSVNFTELNSKITQTVPTYLPNSRYFTVKFGKIYRSTAHFSKYVYCRVR